MAKDLRLPLYPYIIRNSGTSPIGEYGRGAIVEGGATGLDEAAMHGNGLTWEDLASVIAKRRRNSPGGSKHMR